MEISLPADLEKYLENEVARGVYPSANEAIVAAVQCLKEQEAISQTDPLEEIDDLDEKLLAGLKSLDAGLGRPWEEVYQSLKSELQARSRKNA